MSKGKSYYEELDEATRVRPSKAALEALRYDFQAWEAMAESRSEKLSVGALKILIEMVDKLPCNS